MHTRRFPQPERTFVKSAPAFQLLAAAASVLALHAAHAQGALPGQAVFAQCAACHSVDGSNGTGPSLQGVVGRKAGSFQGFRFSRAMRAAGFAWDAKSLDAYIADPQKALPGNVMPYSGLTDEKQRADLVAYLQTLK
jgi:cytochrome c